MTPPDGTARSGHEAAMKCRVPISILATLAVLACSPDDDSNTQRPDSAAIRNQFEAGSGLASRDTIWRIEPGPALLLGRSEGPDAYLFYQIRGAVRLSTGMIVVLDGASRQLRAFSPDGSHVWTAGGPGEGPGVDGRGSWWWRTTGGMSYTPSEGLGSSL